MQRPEGDFSVWWYQFCGTTFGTNFTVLRNWYHNIEMGGKKIRKNGTKKRDFSVLWYQFDNFWRDNENQLLVRKRTVNLAEAALVHPLNVSNSMGVRVVHPSKFVRPSKFSKVTPSNVSKVHPSNVWRRQSLYTQMAFSRWSTTRS